jgi:L-amino acid N-acyltransferase YncA
MNLKIRLIKEQELKRVAEIYKKAYNNLNSGENWTDKSAYKLLKHLFNKQPDLFFAAEADGKLVGGFTAGIKPWCDGDHLAANEIFVDPDYQKQGIGNELAKVMYKTALEKYNVVLVEGTTFRNLEFPLSWHKAKGFEEIKDWMLISADPKVLLENLK